MSKSILTKLNLPHFRPVSGLQSGKAQTIAAVLLPYIPVVQNTEQHLITLDDGDKIVLAENHPLSHSPLNRIILLIHGLTGSYQSQYMIRAAKAFLRLGYSVIRMNIRGCGPGQNLAKMPYHSGQSPDVAAIIQWLHHRYPTRKVTLIGYSLGASLALKLAGEQSQQRIGNLDSVVGVSPPLDLHASSMNLTRVENRPFNDYFVERMVHDAKMRQQFFPHLPLPSFPSTLTFKEFDDLYTAPVCGFKDALDYYHQCSAYRYIDKITLPCFILHAKDDPVVNDVAFQQLPTLPNLDALITEQGGHLAWIGHSGDIPQFGYHWMDHAIVKWVQCHENQIKLT